MIGSQAARLQCVNWNTNFILRNVMTVTFLLLIMIISGGRAYAAKIVEIEWDSVADNRLDHYEVHYGTVSGQYEHQLTTPDTVAAVELADAGAVYYFVTRACDWSETNCSAFSSELSVTAPSRPGDNAEEHLSVDFSANVVRGVVPLTVTFEETSTGNVTSRHWSFGDGATSTGNTAVHTYVQPGVYTVELSANGPAGEARESKVAYVNVSAHDADEANPFVPGYSLPGSALPGHLDETFDVLPIAVGDLQIDDTWQRIDFDRTFDDPIVVVKGLSAFGDDPAVVRIKDIDGTGFSVRVQEWDYSDGWHRLEHTSYIAMERGQHTLPGGVLVEAGSLSSGVTGAFEFQAFNTDFVEPPVVFVSVNSVNELDAVNSRLRIVNTHGFFVGLWEQEYNHQSHAEERIDYIAWEQSVGEVQGLRYEVGLTRGDIGHQPRSVEFESRFDDLPVFVVDLQSAREADPCALRWRDLGAGSARLWVQEERSRDLEIGHRPERVGYFAAANIKD